MISIHAPREGGDGLSDISEVKTLISIHAPREGGDQGPRAPGRQGRRISIHAPREGGDDPPSAGQVYYLLIRFQSTPPARGATWGSPGTKSSPPYFNPRPPRGGRLHQGLSGAWWACNFNPRPPRGGRLGMKNTLKKVTGISIHAPREGGDCPVAADLRRHRRISIHAPREGGDRSSPRWPPTIRYFNPRPPRGGRLADVKEIPRNSRFQSTPPARGATRCLYGVKWG